MAFRKLKAKKYNGILEYYNPKSVNKETKTLYISYRNEYGKSVKKKLDTLDLDEALDQLNKIKSEVRKRKKIMDNEEVFLRRDIKQKKLTLEQMAELYFDQRRAKYNKDDKSRFFKRVVPHLGNKQASKITTDDLLLFQDLLIEKEYAGKTINETINAIRALYNVAIKRRWIDHNPVDRDVIKKVDENSEPGRILTDVELERMYDVFKNGDFELGIIPRERHHLFAKLLYHTGARPEAILYLQVQHCDFNENKIHLKSMKKGKSFQRKIKPEVMNLTKAWIEKHQLKHGDFLFYPIQTYLRSKDESVKRKPVTYSGIRKTAQQVFDKLFNVGIPITALMDRVSFYSLRRTSGTKVYKAKGIMQAMLFLNHTSVTTTQKYLNVHGEIEDIIDIL